MYNIESRTDELAQLLRESGYRLTPQRLAVVQALVEDSHHPSAETVYQRISRVLPTTSLATVYNTLEALREIGQVLEVQPGQGPSRYDVRQPHSHPHLICTTCGRVDDAIVPEEPSHILTDQLSARIVADGWRELHARLDFQGVCPRCQTSSADD